MNSKSIALQIHRPAGALAVGGRSAADHTRHLVFVFDNTYSTLRPKKCVYRVQIGEHLSVEQILLRGPDEELTQNMDVTVPIAPGPGPGSGQLATLYTILEQTKETYGALLEKAKAAGGASLEKVQGGIGVGIGAAVAAPLILQVHRNPYTLYTYCVIEYFS